MKKTFIVGLVILAILLAGCGNKESKDTLSEAEDKSAVSGEVSGTEEELNKEEDLEIPNDFETLEKDIDSMVKELENDSNLKEYENSFEDRDIDTSGRPVFPFEEFEACGDVFYLTDSVNLYIDNGNCIGYTKPNTEIIAVMEYKGWYYVDVSGKPRFVRASDVESNGFAGTKQEYLEATAPASTPEANTNTSTARVDESTKIKSAPATEPDEIPVQTSDKYTPDEAVSVYRSLMEAGGIAWNPDLKDVSSWGTGWIELEKGQPEWLASTDLEAFAYGDTVGNPWTQYYLEVTGSDSDRVYFTEWHN